MISSNITLPFAETIHHATENNKVQLDDDISFPPLIMSCMDDWELFPPLHLSKLENKKIDNEDTVSCDSKSGSSIVWIGRRTFAEVAIYSGMCHQPISTFNLYSKNQTKQQRSSTKRTMKIDPGTSLNTYTINPSADDDDGEEGTYSLIKSTQLKKRHINTKLNHCKSKSLEIAYRRRIALFFKHHCHNNNKHCTSLYPYYQNALLEAKEDLILCKGLRDRLPPRWYFTSRAGTKKAHETRLNKYGRLDIRNIHDKRLNRHGYHLAQITQELKDPRIRQTIYDLMHMAIKKIYWMGSWMDPNLWKSEAAYISTRYLGIYTMLDRYWIPYLEVQAIPNIQECCRKEQRKHIRRLAHVLPTTSSHTKQLFKLSHLQYTQAVLKSKVV
ncbi:hypothetical protein BDA99DRAFT_494438 [Phascolomyces articulosus]|uniref:Uncharacterized protein n=1 Tax=Phascolomyces articulosus TaxID=60185 RepID=A0AAD5KAM2_9FUNG|nr:hypothetical protein BDA99DRAFT_494438 [Phascolomyces articulosus]